MNASRFLAQPSQSRVSNDCGFLWYLLFVKPMDAPTTHMQRPIREYATQDFVQLPETMRVEEALAFIRHHRIGNPALIYFYVADITGRLTGVLQTRILLTAQPDETLADVMIRQVIAIPETATVLEACEFFVLHKFLAFPVIDRDRRITGAVDVNLFNEEVFGIPKTETGDELFQAIGFHISQARRASPLQVFRFRFPWLLVTIGGGTVCAFLTEAHIQTLRHTLAIAFFLTLVLALGESVAVQSLALVLEGLRPKQATTRWYISVCKREALIAIPLALGVGFTVAIVVFMLEQELWPAVVISGSIAIGVGAACFLGISIPTLLHAAKLDLTIAAGPITLALTDIAVLLIYFTLTSWLL
jgi:magnesium transporter